MIPGTDARRRSPGAVHAGTPGLRVFSATLAAQVLIVVTGGVVRITGSGLGCPTWPRCTDESLVPGAADVLTWIEFSNRLIALGVMCLCVASLVLVVRRRHGRRLVALASAQLGGVVAQAGLGGVSVLVDLHPVVVAGHLVLSAFLIYLAVAIRVRVDPRRFWRTPASAAAGRAATAVLMTGLTVVITGTLVTAAGPYGGDAAAARLDLDGTVLTRLHAVAALGTIGMSVVSARAFARAGAPSQVRGTLVAVLALLLVQVGVGTAQVLTGRPQAAVAAHLLLAASLMAVVAYLHEITRSATGVGGPVK